MAVIDTTVADGGWRTLKALLSSKNMLLQFTEDTAVYNLFALDGILQFTATIWKGTVPDGIIGGGYSQAQNDTDKSDFETNFKAAANKSVSVRAADGRDTVRITTANKGTIYKLRTFSFYTADITKLHNMDPRQGLLGAGATYGDITYNLYDVNGNNTNATPALAVRTVVDWEPTYNYEVIGGHLDIPAAIRGGVTDSWYFSVIGLPDVPAASGGNVDFLSEVNLEADGTGRVVLDGRSTTYLTYSATNHTNKIRCIVKHPVGTSQRFQVAIEIFV